MLVVVWSLLAAHSASSLILPHQQLVEHQRGENQQLVKHQKEIQHQEMFTSPSSQHQAVNHRQTSFTFVPQQQEEKSTQLNQWQRSFQLPHHKNQNLHKKQELNELWNQKRMLMLNQDKQQRSMQLPLVSQQNISVANENIEAAMVQKVTALKMGTIPGNACCSHIIQMHYCSMGSR